MRKNKGLVQIGMALATPAPPSPSRGTEPANRPAVKERPILFSAPMIKALLEGRKTQTRRIVKPIPKWAELFPICDPAGMADGHCVKWWDGEHEGVGVAQDCPYGQPGDHLYVRETWAGYREKVAGVRDGVPIVAYRATDEGDYEPGMKWKPSIHMPRWASRLTLKITDVRVARLNDISEADAIAEGCEAGMVPDTGWGPVPLGPDGWTIQTPGFWASAAGKFQMLWGEAYGEDAWALNPWVWAVSFEVVP